MTTSRQERTGTLLFKSRQVQRASLDYSCSFRIEKAEVGSYLWRLNIYRESQTETETDRETERTRESISSLETD